MPLQARNLRQQKLLAYIKSHKPSRLQVLAALYEIDEAGRRKFHRDLDALRGVPYDINMDDDGCYYLASDTATSAVLDAVLTDDERHLFARIQHEYQPGHPYADDVQALLGKLTGRLNEQQQLLEATSVVRYFGPRFTRDYSLYRAIIEQIEAAIRQKYRVSFVYARPVSRELEGVTHRRIEPQAIGVRNGVFYLYGFDVNTSRSYDFRIDKIHELKMLGEKFASFRRPEEIEFEYILAASLVKGGLSERFNNQQLVEMLPDGRAHIKATERPFWVKQELMRYGPKATLLVTSPSTARLKAEIAAEIELMRENYQDE